jgi:NADPH:quinone reductase-like Zn-dependent oxidoreductase
MRRVIYDGVGRREVVSIEERPDPEPQKFEVLTAPAYVTVNPADLLQREGKHPPPPRKFGKLLVATGRA